MGGSASDHESGETNKSSKELQRKHRSWGRTDMCWKISVCLAKVKQCSHWPVQASTLVFFLSTKKVTSERPVALLPALIQWEWLRAPVIQEWKKRSRVRRDATARKQWKSRKNSVGSLARNGEGTLTIWKIWTKEQLWSWIWPKPLKKYS